ncbi:MAG: YeeE/YedE family protein [Candidatus Bathyarchaeota archaeon]|jgi:uncharacterized membrane protein YedE/YeeE
MIDTSLIFSGLVVGIIFGFILQRGRFCMNSAFRDIILLKDYKLLKAVALAIVVQMIGFHLTAEMGWIQLNPKPMFWGAMIFGGFIFGIGMVLAAGCASGTTYRVGEGMMGSFIALLGLMIGGLITSGGVLKELKSYLQSNTAITTTDLGVSSGPLVKEGSTSLTLANVFGLNPWIFVAIIAVIIITLLIWKGKDNETKVEGTLSDRIFKIGWSWWVTGIAVGIIGIIAFLAFKNYALGISGGWFGFLNALITGDADKLNWFTFLVIGVVIGAAIAAGIASEFKLRAPDAGRLLQQFIGGLVMGTGAVIGTACNIGHILSGIPQLALSSILGGIFIILGCWATAYIMFMRG